MICFLFHGKSDIRVPRVNVVWKIVALDYLNEINNTYNQHNVHALICVHLTWERKRAQRSQKHEPQGASSPDSFPLHHFALRCSRLWLKGEPDSTLYCLLRELITLNRNKTSYSEYPDRYNLIRSVYNFLTWHISTGTSCSNTQWIDILIYDCNRVLNSKTLALSLI